jgi:hypothetical protein
MSAPRNARRRGGATEVDALARNVARWALAWRSLERRSTNRRAIAAALAQLRIAADALQAEADRRLPAGRLTAGGQA